MEYTLVIDLHTKVGKEGEHYGTLVVEQSPIQAYWVHALHRHHHGQMTKAELHHHLQILHDNGFVEIDRDYVQHKDERPPKYYIILNKEHDWNINEILYPPWDEHCERPQACKIIEARYVWTQRS